MMQFSILTEHLPQKVIRYTWIQTPNKYLSSKRTSVKNRKQHVKNLTVKIDYPQLYYLDHSPLGFLDCSGKMLQRTCKCDHTHYNTLNAI